MSQTNTAPPPASTHSTPSQSDPQETGGRRVLAPSQQIADCDAVVVSLASHRFVIVRSDGRIRLWSAERLCRPVREFKPGESVYYDGQKDTVKAMAVY